MYFHWSKTLLNPSKLFGLVKFVLNVGKFSKYCFICFTQKFSVVRRTEVFVMKCTYKNFCTPQYRKILRKADEASFYTLSLRVLFTYTNKYLSTLQQKTYPIAKSMESFVGFERNRFLVSVSIEKLVGCEVLYLCNIELSNSSIF